MQPAEETPFKMVGLENHIFKNRFLLAFQGVVVQLQMPFECRMSGKFFSVALSVVTRPRVTKGLK